ncbi:MAG: hypothetical protein AB7T22_08275 [Calditrichaceae bacterium]
MRTFLLIILIIAGVIAGAIYYVYKNISYQPEWYNTTEVREFSDRLADTGKVKSRIKQKLINQGSAEISPEDLSIIVFDQLEKETSADVGEIIKAVHSSIDKERISIEMVVDLSKIPKDKVPGNVESLFERIVSSTPDSVLQNLFVKIDGKPIISEGEISLGNEAVIYIGKMKFKLSDEYGEKYDRKNLRRYLSTALFEVSDIKLAKDRIILKK